METATISSTFRVVIPRAAREKLDLKPGQKVHVIAYDGRIQIIPVRPVKEMRGFLKGMDADFDREPDRDFGG